MSVYTWLYPCIVLKFYLLHVYVVTCSSMYMCMYMSALLACMGIAILGLSSVLFLVTVSWHSESECVFVYSPQSDLCLRWEGALMWGSVDEFTLELERALCVCYGSN